MAVRGRMGHEFWRKTRNVIWGIAFLRKVRYFRNNEELVPDGNSASAYGYSMNEEVPW